MNKRPKSREETPKEGSDSARRYRTATICGRAAQSARPFESFPVNIRMTGSAHPMQKIFDIYHYNIKYLNMNPAALTLTCPQPKISSRIRDRARSLEIYPCAGAESLSEIKRGPAGCHLANGAEFAGLR